MEAFQHFGLRTSPFDGRPDPRFFYSAPSHSETLATLEFAIHSRKPCTIVLGESGSGKTLLGCVLLQRGIGSGGLLWIHGIGQPESGTDVVFCPPGNLPRSDPFNPRHAVAYSLADWIRTRYPTSGPVVVVVDNADALRDHNWDELLALVANEMHATQAASLVLLGLPSVLSTLSTPHLARLQRRVFRTCHLDRLTGEDVAAFVRHRWTVAGGDESGAFTSAALDLIHRFSDGNPALVNQLCDNAMLDAFSDDRDRIDARDVVATLQAITGRTEQRRCLPHAAALDLPDIVSADAPPAPRVKEVVADVTYAPLGDRLRTIESRLSEALSRVAAARTLPAAPPTRATVELDDKVSY